MSRLLICVILGLCGAELIGCSQQEARYGTTEIKFRDDVVSQTSPTVQFSSVPLSLKSGDTATLTQLAGGKKLVAVLTRGYSGAVCPYCSTQTAGLINAYADFQKRNTEVVVIYPLNNAEDGPYRAKFLAKINELNQQGPETETPFPLVMDLGLKAVDLLGIRKDLSKPATYILDAQGGVRFAYVGESLADRPSVKVLLAQLDQIDGTAKTTSGPAAGASPAPAAGPPPTESTPSVNP